MVNLAINLKRNTNAMCKTTNCKIRLKKRTRILLRYYLCQRQIPNHKGFAHEVAHKRDFLSKNDTL